MKIVIEMPELMYKQLKWQESDIREQEYVYLEAILDGTPLPKGHGRLIDGDKAESITWEEPSYIDVLNAITEIRDKMRELPTVIEADKE